MPCEFKRDEAGAVTAIVCSRGRARKRCVHCGGPGSQLCDFPVLRDGRKTTCDAALCRHCSTKPHAGDVDLCRPHAAQWDQVTGRPKVGPGA